MPNESLFSMVQPELALAELAPVAGLDTAAETGAGGNYLVYQSVNEAGEVQYVGKN